MLLGEQKKCNVKITQHKYKEKQSKRIGQQN